MIISVVVAAVALRAGLALRRARRFRERRPAGLRETHLRFAKPAVLLLMLGFLGGPVSAIALRNWEPFRTFHSAVGLVAAALFVATYVLGRRIEQRVARPLDAHALLGMLAMLFAVVAAVAGFVLLP